MSDARPFTVMVTGGAGYIGSHAVLALRDAGWPVVVVDNLVTGFAWAVPADVPLIEANVADRQRVTQTIATHQVGAIMHFAGSVVVPESVADPLKYYRNNSGATQSLLETAVACGVRHVIFSSTAATYGTPDTVSVSETSPTRPINPYGHSKLMSEQMLADVAAAHPLNYCALRYFNVAGADPLGRSGQSTVGATHLIKVAVEAALGKRDHVAIFGTDFDTPDGTGVRDYIHVADLAAAHVAALDLLIDQPGRSHVMNCGYGRGYSVAQVCDAVERVSGRTIERVLAPRRAGDPAALVADPALIRATLDWHPRHADLDRMIAHALTWEGALDATIAERQRARA